MSTSSMANAIDLINSSVMDYFLKLLEAYLPFVLGFAILMIAWGIMRWRTYGTFLQRFF